jgi:ParB-like chromosome segregation protein Spo0J
LKAIATAHRWRERIIAGEIYGREQLATEAKVTRSYAGRILRLVALSPDIVDGIIRDRLIVDRSLKQLIAGLPLEWKNQQSCLRLST